MDSKVTKHEEPQGLASIVGKWKDFEEVKVQIDDLAYLRKDAGTRKTRYGGRGDFAEQHDHYLYD